MLADPSYGQDVPKLIGHERVVWEVHPVSCELDTRGFGDGSLRHGRAKLLGRGSWGLAVMSEERKVTASTRTSLWRKVSLSCGARGTSAVGGTFYKDCRNVHLY